MSDASPFPRMIFVNVPVSDLARSTAFYEALGFTRNPQFSSDSNSCMVWSETIYLMILTHERWRDFTSRPIPDRGSSEVMLCLTCDSRDEVNKIADAAGGSGGESDVNPSQDHGFMFGRSFADPDGHVWELTWMDPAAVAGDAPAEATA